MPKPDETRLIEFPPHARGWTPDARLDHDQRRQSRFPRTRGDGPVLSAFLDSCLQSRRFPRTRGDGPIGFARHGQYQNSRVSPARAGMDPASTYARSIRERCRFPPHARGWTPRHRETKKYGHPDVSPARAGMDLVLTFLLVTRLQMVSPARAGMDHSRTSDHLDAPEAAFPPHARGWTLGGVGLVGCGVVSPARAGMDPARTSSRRSPSFPRTRGDGPPLDLPFVDESPFPPHARGWNRAASRPPALAADRPPAGSSPSALL